MDNLQDLLAKYRPQEPPEMKAIKDYIYAQFNEAAHVLLRERDVVITIRSSAMAGALRMHAYQLGKLAGPGPNNSTKKMIFRVGEVTGT